MIRNDVHYYTALRHLQVAAEEISELRKVANSSRSDSATVKLIERKESFALSLRRHISAYLSTQQSESGPDAISIASRHTKGVSPGYGLFLARASRSLKQSELALALGVKQPVVSRIENGGESLLDAGEVSNFDQGSPADVTQEDAISTRTLSRWADATGYSLNITFTQVGKGWGDPTSLNSFALNAITFRNQFCHQPDYLLSQIMLELAVATSADVVTCYLGDESPDHLRLVFTNGAQSLYGMDGMIMRANVPIKVLDDEPAFILDIQEDERYATSTFAVREGICSVCHLTFQAGFYRGVVFLSFRQKPIEIRPEYIERLLSVSSILEWCFTNIDSKKITTVGTIPRLDEESLQVSEIAANLSQFLEATFAVAIDEPSWSGMAARNMLSSLAEELGVVNGCVWIDLFEDEGQSNETVKLIFGMGDTSIDPHSRARLKILIREHVQKECYFVVSKERKNPRISSLLHEIALSNHTVISVPLIDDAENVSFGSLSILTPESRGVSAREIHKCISTGVALCKANAAKRTFVRKRHTEVDRDRLAALARNLCNQVGADSSTHRCLSSLAELINSVFGADLTDIWLVNWPNAKINVIDSARGQSETVLAKLGPEALKELFHPRAEGFSQTILRRGLRRPILIQNAQYDDRVAPRTRALGFKTMVGIPVVGPTSHRASAIIWVRFLKNVSKQLTNGVDKTIKSQYEQDFIAVAGLAHLILNPGLYGPWAEFEESEDPIVTSYALNPHMS